MNKSVALIVLIGMAFGLSSAASAEESEMDRALAETHLYHLKHDYQVWEALPKDVQDARTILSQSITMKLIKLSSLDFSVDTIRSPTLEILCLLEENPETFNAHKHVDLSNLAGKFLDRVHVQVRNKITSSQQVMRGRGCYVSPSSTEMTVPHRK